MICNLKALGLVLLAVFALSAVAASAASATNDAFMSGSANGKTDLTGGNVAGTQPRLTVDGAEVSCTKVSYTGTLTKNSISEVTAHPIYGVACEALGSLATVNTEGCDYVLTGTTDTVGGQTHATVSIECTTGKEITVTVPDLGITFHIPAQGPRSGVTYTNKNKAENGAGNETLTVKATIKSIVHTCTGVFCFLVENEGNSSNAEYTDDVIVTGYEDSGTFSQNSTTHAWSGTHGNQVCFSTEGCSPPTPQFHSETSKTTLIAEDNGNEEMSFKAGLAACEESGYKGTMSATTTTTVTIAPEFEACEAFGFANTEVLFNGCAYVLHRGELAGISEGSVDIECPAGKAIEVVARNRGLLKCRVTIGGQSGLTTITETNKGAGSSRDISLDLNLTGVSYAQEAGEGLGKCEAGSFNNGEIAGTPTMIGENEEKKQVGIWAE